MVPPTSENLRGKPGLENFFIQLPHWNFLVTKLENFVAETLQTIHMCVNMFIMIAGRALVCQIGHQWLKVICHRLRLTSGRQLCLGDRIFPTQTADNRPRGKCPKSLPNCLLCDFTLCSKASCPFQCKSTHRLDQQTWCHLTLQLTLRRQCRDNLRFFAY